MHNNFIPINKKLINKQKNNLLYEKIINSNLKNILIFKKEQEDLMDFLEKRKQIGENYLQVDFRNLPNDKQTLNDEDIQESITTSLDLQKEIPFIAWDKRKKIIHWFLGLFTLIIFGLCLWWFICLVEIVSSNLNNIEWLPKVFWFIATLILLFGIRLVLLYSQLQTILTKLIKWLKKWMLIEWFLDSIKFSISSFKFVLAEFQFRRKNKRKKWKNSFLKKLSSKKTSVIVLDLDTYPISDLGSLLYFFDVITKKHNKENNKKLTFFYLTSEDILDKYNQFDFYVYSISEINELWLKKILNNDFEIVNNIFLNFKEKIDFKICEDIYDFLVDYKKLYKTYYKDHFTLIEFFIILMLKKYFYTNLRCFITNKKEDDNIINKSTLEKLTNLKNDPNYSSELNLNDDFWEYAYQNSFFRIQTVNSDDFYSVFSVLFLIKLLKFSDLNNKCSCLKKYKLVVQTIINNVLPNLEYPKNSKNLKSFIEENLGSSKQYLDFSNKIKNFSEKYPNFSNDLLDMKDEYYRSIKDFIYSSINNVSELKNIYNNTLGKYWGNNNHHYIFVLASFLNQIFEIKSTKIVTKSIKEIISNILFLTKNHHHHYYYLTLKNIFFLLDHKLQVYMIEIIQKKLVDYQFFINDWLTVFSNSERQVFGTLLKHYRLKKFNRKSFPEIKYHTLKWWWRPHSKKIIKFGLTEWFKGYILGCDK